MASKLDQINYPYLYGRLDAAVELFLEGGITKTRLFEIREQVRAEESLMKGRTS